MRRFQCNGLSSTSGSYFSIREKSHIASFFVSDGYVSKKSLETSVRRLSRRKSINCLSRLSSINMYSAVIIGDLMQWKYMLHGSEIRQRLIQTVIARSEQGTIHDTSSMLWRMLSSQYCLLSLTWLHIVRQHTCVAHDTKEESLSTDWEEDILVCPHRS